MPGTLYIDTATNGRWFYRESNASRSQPQMCRLAFLLIGEDNEEAIAYCRLVRPTPAWRDFSAEAIVGHGITPEMVAADGIPLAEIMAALAEAVGKADHVVAYNFDYHRRVIAKSAMEIGQDPDAALPEDGYCAMREATDIVMKPRMSEGGFAWPKQAEAYHYFTGEHLPKPGGDPIDRGLVMVRSVRAIWDGILGSTTPATNAGVPHR